MWKPYPTFDSFILSVRLRLCALYHIPGEAITRDELKAAYNERMSATETADNFADNWKSMK